MDDRHLQAVSEFMPPAGIVRPRSAHDTVESVVEKFAKGSERLFMSPDDATALATALYNRAERLTPEPDVVVGIATGGLFVAHAVARGLSVPCHVLRIQRKATRLKRHVSRCRPLVRLVAAVLEAPAIGSPTRALLDRMNGLDEIDTTSPPPVAGKHVILVDDCVESGQRWSGRWGSSAAWAPLR